MKVLVVEDEPVVARRLLRLLAAALAAECPDEDHSLRHAPTLAAARRRLADDDEPEVVFLDLRLDGQDGFELLRASAAERFHTVVVSAHVERALEAFELGVLDFVPKPFDEARLRRAVARLRRRAQGAAEVRQLAVRKGARVELVAVASIVRVQGAGDYSELRCADGARHLHAKTLDALERLLPPRFVRVHRSTLVDLDRAEALETRAGGRYTLVLRGGERVPVGRTRVDALRARWGESR